MERVTLHTVETEGRDTCIRSGGRLKLSWPEASLGLRECVSLTPPLLPPDRLIALPCTPIILIATITSLPFYTFALKPSLMQSWWIVSRVLARAPPSRSRGYAPWPWHGRWMGVT